MLKGLRALFGNVQQSAEVIQQSPRFDVETIEKQIHSAVAEGTLATYDQAVEELKARSTPTKGKIKIRKTTDDYSFYLQSFGYIRELSKKGNELPDPTSIGYDQYLQEIWIQEPILAGAVYSMSAKMTALNWQVTGLREEAMATSQILARAAYSTAGYDWGGFISSVSQDFYTTNDGTFWETVKKGNALYGMLTDISHIDSLACTLTGNSKNPMLYRSDVTGQMLKFKPGEFIHFASMPSPREERFGAGYCAVSRALRAAKLLMGLHDYDIEKLNNLPPEGVAAVTGLTKDEFRTAITLWQVEREKNNSLTFPQVLWLIGSQPNIQVKIDFAGFSQLPESFDREAVVTQYVNTLALDFGVDAREFWPISTSSLGTAAESEIQHMKAKGKGPGELISLTERKINGELPEGVHFEFDTQDVEEDLKAAEIAAAWINAYMPLLTGGLGAPQGAQTPPNADGTPTPPPAPAEPLVPIEDILRILADHNVIPNTIVGDDREVILDTDVHIKENSAPASTFYWKQGIVTEKRLPPIIVNSRFVDVPDADVLKGGSGSGHHGHVGRPGKQGGSLPGKGGGVVVRGKTWNGYTVYGYNKDNELPEVVTNVLDGALSLATIYNLDDGFWEITAEETLQHDDMRGFTGFDKIVGGILIKNPNTSAGAAKYRLLMYDFTKGESRDYVLDVHGSDFHKVINTIRTNNRTAKANLPDSVYAKVMTFEDANELATSAWYTALNKEYPFPVHKEDPERNIKGEPIPVKEVTRGASVTQKAIKDELELWRTVDTLNLYAVEEEDQADYVKRTTKK